MMWLLTRATTGKMILTCTHSTIIQRCVRSISYFQCSIGYSKGNAGFEPALFTDLLCIQHYSPNHLFNRQLSHICGISIFLKLHRYRLPSKGLKVTLIPFQPAFLNLLLLFYVVKQFHAYPPTRHFFTFCIRRLFLVAVTK